ncbi:MAG: hypothetical protein V1725_05870 [archaeon]
MLLFSILLMGCVFFLGMYFWLAAIVDIAQRKIPHRAGWLFAVVCTPFLGAVWYWLLFVNKNIMPLHREKVAYDGVLLKVTWPLGIYEQSSDKGIPDGPGILEGARVLVTDKRIIVRTLAFPLLEMPFDKVKQVTAVKNVVLVKLGRNVALWCKTRKETKQLLWILKKGAKGS